MNEPLYTAMVLAAGLVGFGAWSAILQVRGMRDLAVRNHVPNDEHSYFRGRYRRRLVVSVLMLLVGLQIGGAYLSGLEAVVAAGGNPQGGPLPRHAIVRIWGFFWIWILIQTFALIGLAVADAWASRQYWSKQLRELREEHHAKLRRDLAVYKSQHQGRQRGYGGRLGGADN